MNKIAAESLRAELEALGHLGVLALFDFIEQERKAGRVISKIGSATVDLYGKMAELEARPHTTEEGIILLAALPSHHFGRTDGKRTPVEMLMEFARELHKCSSDQIERLNQFCRDLAEPDDQKFKVIRGKLILYRPVN